MLAATDALAVARALYALHNGVCVPDYERLLEQCYSRFLTRLPRPVIIDIGAHSGRHLARFVPFARDGGRVIAFEPIPALARALRKRFVEPNVEIREVALSREAGEQTFHHLFDDPEMSGLHRRSDRLSAVGKLVRVQVDTLDHQAANLDRVTYVKIDIEGGEIDCLIGARETIMRHRPLISIEYGKAGYLAYGHTALSLFSLTTSLDYVLSDLFGNLIATDAEWLTICDAAYWDYFMVPCERIEEWRAYFGDLSPNR